MKNHDDFAKQVQKVVQPYADQITHPDAVIEILEEFHHEMFDLIRKKGLPVEVAFNYFVQAIVTFPTSDEPGLSVVPRHDA